MSRELAAILAGVSKSRPEFNLEKAAFKQQLDFVQDHARLKALFCTRRAAKSYTAGLYMMKEALDIPNSNILYLGLTRESSKGIIWKDIIKAIHQKCNVLLRFNETELTASFSNGSVIRVTGADADESEMNKLLGKKYRLVIIDEASMYSVNMRQLVYGILKPAVADHRGTICMMGTASNITRGLFYDITTSKEPGWSVHTWTAHENPYVSTQWKEELADIERDRPEFKETTLFKQWYLNQWVVDEEARVYRYTRDRDDLEHLPRDLSGFSYLCGIDLAHSPDYTAIVVGAYHPHYPVLYVVEAKKYLKMDVTACAEKIREFDKKYNLDVKVIDGANKMAVEELNNRHGLGLLPTDKVGKNDFITIMNDEFVQGKIKLLPGARDLKEEYETLVWVTDNGVVKIPKKEDPQIPNDCCFVAGTMVETSAGPKPIQDIAVGDTVLTREGMRPVIRCGPSGRHRIVTLTLSNWTKIKCTGYHPFMTQHGWVRADELTPMHRLISVDQWKRSQYLAENGRDTKAVGISQQQSSGRNRYIDILGKWLMGLFLKDGMFITRMGIPLITIFQTLSVCREGSIASATKKSSRSAQAVRRAWLFLKELGRLRRPGTSLPQVKNGIRNMHGHGEVRIERKSQPNVLSVVKHTKETPCLPDSGSYALANATQNKETLIKLTGSQESASGARGHIDATSSLKSDSVVCLVDRKTQIKSALVYALEVEDQKEYFANGILVSNCDAALYMWRYAYTYLFEKPKSIAIPGSLESWEPDHIERLKKQAQKDEKNEYLQKQGDDFWDYSPE